MRVVLIYITHNCFLTNWNIFPIFFHLIFFKGCRWPFNTALRFLVWWIIFDSGPFVSFFFAYVDYQWNIILLSSLCSEYDLRGVNPKRYIMYFSHLCCTEVHNIQLHMQILNHVNLTSSHYSGLRIYLWISCRYTT